MTRVVLPYHLRNLAKVDGEVVVEARTAGEVLDALEAAHLVLRGAVRDRSAAGAGRSCASSRARRTCRMRPYDKVLPEAVLRGDEPFLVVGAVVGG